MFSRSIIQSCRASLRHDQVRRRGRNTFTYSGELQSIPYSDAPDILNKSYTITADVAVPADGGEGMIATMGRRFGGYGLYLLKGKPLFLYNFLDLQRFRWEGQQVLAPGKHTIAFDFKYDGLGFGKGGTGVLKVDGRDVATQTLATPPPSYSQSTKHSTSVRTRAHP